MAFEKITKEILTDELIKKDIIYLFKNDNHTAVNVILSVVSLLLVAFLSIFTPFAWLLILIPALVLIYSYNSRKKKIKEIENGEFTVVTDELLYEKQGEIRTEATFYKSKYISYLQFSGNGRWEVSGDYYAWSEKYKMSDSGICNTANAKDIFYLVLYNSTYKIAIGYNTKFFDYKK